MGFNIKLLLSLVLLVSVSSMANASIVFTVGDSISWSGLFARAGYNYTQWTEGKIFLLGDSVRFVYNPKNHTKVLSVMHDDYHACTNFSMAPFTTYNTGNDIIPLKRSYQYFISGDPVECRNGLKVRIHALKSCPNRAPNCGNPTPTFPDLAASAPAMSADTTSAGGEAASAPTMSPNSPKSTSAAGEAASAPTMSPNSTSAVGRAPKSSLPLKHNTSSSASKFPWYIPGIAALVVVSLGLGWYLGSEMKKQKQMELEKEICLLREVLERP